MPKQKKGIFSFLLFLAKWFLLFGLGLAFLPITIAIILGYLIIKKVDNKKWRAALLIILTIPSLLVGAGWIYGMGHINSGITSSPTPSPTAQPTSIVEATTTFQPFPTSPANEEGAKVTRVIDGDTIELENGKRLRYIGIDTPEISGTNPDCYAREAYERNKELVEGKEVKLEKDVSETDKYGRLLRYVYVGDTMINEKLVKEGFASVYTYPPDVKYQDRFIQVQEEARNNNVGLWSSCKSTPTSIPTTKSVATPKPTQSITSTGGNYSCDCSKTCSEISSCAEAQYLLNTCGCSQRDGDDDGIACDGAPLRCQQ